MANEADSKFSKEHLKWLDRQFARTWPLLERAIDRMHESYGKDYVWSRIEDGTAQLFPGVNSVLLSEINDVVDGSRAFNIWLAAGEMQEVLQLASIAENTARKAGCSSVTFVGRPGFMRKPPDGYQTAGVIMRKEL